MYYFIVNPNSCCGRGGRVWKKMEKILIHRGISYEAHVTEKVGDARQYAKKLTEGCKESRLIVVIGGDGTVNEILNGLSFCGNVTLGYIPAGSGNDLARSLKLPKKPSRCLKRILKPTCYKMLDYGVLSYGEDDISCRRFIVSTGIGMDAAVCHNLLYSKTEGILRKVHWGKLGYILIGIKQLILAKPTKGHLVLNGVQKVEFSHVYFISAHIHPFEGGGFKFAPDAKYDDGKLSVCLMNNKKKRKLVPVLINSFLRKESHNSGVRFYQCEELEIYTDRPMAVHVDGESCLCQNHLQVQCINKKIRIIG